MTTDTRDALLPCPFCGGVVEMHHPKGGAYNDITYLLCDSCGAVCSFRPNLKGSKAMAAWNCRTPRTEDARDGARWQPIATAPTGAKGYAFMRLAWGDDEDKHTGDGIRCGDRFFAAGVFYTLSPEDGRRYRFRETEVTPTHWMPLTAITRPETTR